MSTAQQEHQRLKHLFDSGVTRKMEWRVKQLNDLKANFEKYEQMIYKACAKDMGRPLHETMCSEFAGPVSVATDVLGKLPKWT